MTEHASPPRISPWPHRLAVALALVTFPLIWVGGLVTTYDAGMAVPDWPGTYGYNLFLYPLSTWLSGPFDLFVEHGHRLLGALAGLLTIALVIVVWFNDSRRWVRDAALAALALVIFQGVLGGMRVLLDDRLLALVHGCTGPLFFAWTVCLVEVTSRHWRAQQPNVRGVSGSRFVRSAWIAAGLAYLQLTVGALLRHIPVDAPPQLFRAALLFHLVFAAVLAIQLGMLTINVLTNLREHRSLRLPAIGLGMLIMLQVSLGISTYVMKYSWPAWMDQFGFAAAFVVREKSFAQASVITLHVAVGSLMLAGTTALALRSSRIFLRQTAREVGSRKLFLGVAV